MVMRKIPNEETIQLLNSQNMIVFKRKNPESIWLVMHDNAEVL